MTKNETEETTKEQCRNGIPMTDEELAAYEESFQNIEESIGMVMEEGDDL